MTSKYDIQDFGNDTECDTKEELIKVLTTKYDNSHVAIVHTPKGKEISKIEFVSIKDKRVFHSYKDNTLFDFNSI